MSNFFFFNSIHSLEFHSSALQQTCIVKLGECLVVPRKFYIDLHRLVRVVGWSLISSRRRCMLENETVTRNDMKLKSLKVDSHKSVAILISGLKIGTDCKGLGLHRFYMPTKLVC